MTVTRIKGLKRYRSKGRWYAYHRKSGARLKAEFDTAAFLLELAALEKKFATKEPLAGTLRLLFAEYRASSMYTDLAPATRVGYMRMMELLRPIDDMPLVDLLPPFIAGLRDRIGAKHGRRQANYVLSVISVACEFGKERGLVASNPVKGIRRIRRPKSAPKANRPWAQEERRVVLSSLPAQLRLPVALAMFTGLRKNDVLTLRRADVANGRIRKPTSKTGQQISIPVHPQLATILDGAGNNDAEFVALTSLGTPWTVSGFNSSFIKAINRLEKEHLVQPGLTFHGLRHTVGTLLTEAGVDIDTVRRWLGQKTLAMAIHYSETADTSSRMQDAMTKFNPLGAEAED